jgi:hypothetical protein
MVRAAILKDFVVMIIVDQLAAQVANLASEVKSLPAQLDTIAACKEAGVRIPASGKFATLDDLDLALNAAFSPDGAPPDKAMMAKRIALKNAIFDAGLCAQTSRPAIDGDKAQEAAVKNAVALLKRHGIKIPEGDKMFRVADVDAAAKERNLSISDRFELKTTLEAAQMLDTTGTVLAKAPIEMKPSPAMIHSIFATELQMNTPVKISVAELNRAMTARDIPVVRRMQIKGILEAARLLTE